MVIFEQYDMDHMIWTISRGGHPDTHPENSKYDGAFCTECPLNGQFPWEVKVVTVITLIR